MIVVLTNFTIAFDSGVNTQSHITHNIRIVLIEVIDGVILGGTLQQRADTVTQILDIVVNCEPLVHICLVEVNAVANLDSSTDKVLGFNIDKVRNLIVFVAQVYGLNQLVSGLGTTSRQLQTLQILVIVKQNGLRTTNHLTLTILGNNIDSITSPNINAYNAI